MCKGKQQLWVHLQQAHWAIACRESRLKSVSEALEEKGYITSGVSCELVEIKGGEPALLEEDGVVVKDLIFLNE